MRKNFFIQLAGEARLRVLLEIKAGKVTDLVIQLEVLINKWVPIVRYNYAHGYPHRDLILADGSKIKELLEEDDLGKIATEAIRDIKKNWLRYLRRCGYEYKENV